MKRYLALLLALAMVLGLFSGLDLSANAASYSYNSGKREEICTELSSAAKNYYTEGYTYGRLSSLSGSNLRTNLRTLITTNRSTVGYNGLRDYLPYTDAYYGNNSKMVLFYCNGIIDSTWDSGKTWNREHMWPQSLGGNAVEADLHAMRPADPRMNSTRNNNLYGYATDGKTAESSETNGSLAGGTYVSGIFEPYDYAKGDCARVVLYDYVVASSMSSVTEVFTDVNTLLEWCALDPVDEFEMSRNDVAQEIQGCRNPFVDYPELAWLLLGKQIPSDLVTPTKPQQGSGSVPVQHTITATSNNTAYGTVSVSGNIITATPRTGYYVKDYTVLLGSATVTREGDVFTVTAVTDCSIRINFAKIQSVTVSFNGKADSITVNSGDAVTMPEGPVEIGYTFIGWTTYTCVDSTSCPTYYIAGKTYAVDASMNLKPLYSYVEGNAESPWTLAATDDDLYAGAQIVIASYGKDRVAGDITATYLSEVSATFSESLKLGTVPDEAMIFTLGGQTGAWTLISEEGKFLGTTALKSMAWDSGEITWDISISEGMATISSTNRDYGRILHNVTAKRFTTYASNTTTAMLLPQIYMRETGTVYYSTEIKTCDHSTVTYSPAVEATCTMSGSLEHYTCNSCGHIFADADCTRIVNPTDLIVHATGHIPGNYEYTVNRHWMICSVCGAVASEAEEHDWSEGEFYVNAYDEEPEFILYTCNICGMTKKEYLDVGSKLTITFSVPQGVAPVENMYTFNGYSVTLPENPGTPAEGYTFVGWSTVDVKDQTSVTGYYKAGEEIWIRNDLALKALYKYTVAGDNGPEQWNLVTDGMQLVDGAQVVMAANAKGVVAGSLSSQYLAKETAIFSEDLTAIEILPETALVLTLGTNEEGRTLENAEGQLLGATALKKLAWDSGVTSWNISVEEGSATIYSTNSSYGRFLYNVGSPRFTTYTSNTSVSMLLPQIYILVGGGTAYYTTEFKTEETPAEPTLDPNVTMGHTLNLASDISINYAVRVGVLAGYDTYVLECVLPTYEGNTRTGSRTVTVEPTVNGSYYYFTLTGVTAVNMNDEIIATLRMTKGEESYVSNPDTYSVAQYAYSQLGKDTIPESLKILCANLLRYGAAAQSFKGYRTDALADSALTETQKGYLVALEDVTFGNYNKDLGDMAAPTVTWAGKSLLLDSKVTIRYIFDLGNFKGNAEDLSLRVTYKNRNGETVTTVVSGGAEKYGTAEGRYSIDFDGLLAAELRTVVHANIYVGDTCLSSTLEYSVDTYGNNKTGTLGTLCRALVAYSDCAKAYFS